MNTKTIFDYLDSLVIIAFSLILITAFAFQFSNNELPCALCIMQRMGFYAMAYGLILNLIKERNPRHYLLVALCAVINSFLALLQVVSHIVPNTGSFGSAIFGLHMYSWNFVISMLVISYAVAGGLLTPKINELTLKYTAKINKLSRLAKLGIGLLLLSLVTNILSAISECGPYFCPSNPHSYWLIDLIKHTA